MKRHVLVYGLIGGILVAVLKWSEYRFLVLEHSIELYGGLVAATFAVLGIWLGIRLGGSRPSTLEDEIAAPVPVAAPVLVQSSSAILPSPDTDRPLLTPEESKLSSLGITRRELEVLQLVAKGMSNREIADKLFVSENTIKTHCSRVFDKLGARRRTQAVQLGKDFGLLP